MNVYQNPFSDFLVYRDGQIDGTLLYNMYTHESVSISENSIKIRLVTFQFIANTQTDGRL